MGGEEVSESTGSEAAAIFLREGPEMSSGCCVSHCDRLTLLFGAGGRGKLAFPARAQ